MINLFEKYPELKRIQANIESAIKRIKECFRSGGKLLLCGSGGSAADCEHISGELLKGFLSKRNVDEKFKFKLKSNYVSDIANKLQGGLPAISLVSNAGVMTAITNDIGGEMIFAQQVFALAKPKDVLIAISTSGNSLPVYNAAVVAKAMDCSVIGLTGEHGGKLKEISDIIINVPQTETYKVQELHLPVYHYICAEIEREFFGE